MPPQRLLVIPLRVVHSHFTSHNPASTQPGLGCLGQRRMVKAGWLGRVTQGAGSIPAGPAWGGLTPAPCWRCAAIAVLCFTHLKYPLSLHGGKGGLPTNLGQPRECAPRSKSQQCLCSTGPTGALLGSALNGR